MSSIRISIFLSVWLALFAFVGAPTASAVMPGDGQPAPQLVRGQNYSKSELLVKFRSAASGTHIQSLTTDIGAVDVQQFRRPARLRQGPIDQWRLVKLGAGSDLTRARAALLNSRLVDRVEYNYEVRVLLTPNDPGFSNLWGMNNIGQTGGTADADIDATEAWDQHTGNGTVVVAVIDTGVAYDHPDLAANMWTNSGEIPGNGIDDDGNGYIDDVYGYNFVNNTANPYDDHGHGTHCAGTIAAVGNNGVGVAGVTWSARIMAVKFLSASGSGSTTGAISAVLYAANNGAQVMSNSWGGGGFSQALLDAINTADQAGALFVAAAGNSGLNTDVSPNYPSNYAVQNVVSVAATDHSDLKASFSNYGLTTVDLGAPGVSVYSTVPTVGNACCSNPTGYHYLSGTSMATPHVSGAAALLFSRYPGISHYQVRDRLLFSSDPVASLAGITVTGGRLNIARAITPDDAPPAPVFDLATTNIGSTTVTLRWSATGDDGNSGNASKYDLRYSYSPIDDGNFNQATAVTGTPKPGVPGTLETFTVAGLVSDTNYYFALRVSDDVGNNSNLSNVVSARTRAVKIVFQDNMESGPANWTVAGSDGVGGPALWHLSTHRSNSPSTAMYYGIESTLNFNTGVRNFGSITSAPINLVGETDAALTFTHFLQTENFSPYDTARVQVSSNNGSTWTDLYVTALSTTGMVTYNASLSAYDGQAILLRFSFDTVDAVSNAFEGWVVDDVAVTAAQSNRAPLANAGGPYNAQTNQAIVFNGNGSSDPDGDALTYSWTFGDGTSGSGPNPTHAYANAGNYTVTLVVNDGTLNSSPATAAVAVVATPPVANAGPDQTVNKRVTVKLNGSGSYDPDGSIVSYRWRKISGPLVRLLNASSAIASFRAPVPKGGTPVKLVFELMVTDNSGSTAADQVLITVNP